MLSGQCQTLFHGSGTGSTHPHFSHSTHALPVCCRWMIQTDHEWFPVMNGRGCSHSCERIWSNLAFVLSSIQYIYTSKGNYFFFSGLLQILHKIVTIWDNVIITLTLHFCIYIHAFGRCFYAKWLICIENMHLICFRDLNLWSCHSLHHLCCLSYNKTILSFTIQIRKC